jgi:hypothetical protein
MRRLIIATLLVSGLVGIVPRKSEATQLSIELRFTPPFVRPNGLPSLCPMLAFSLTEHLWAGVGYEALQDYDAILWTSEYEGHKPIAMSGLRAGAWYRGDLAYHSMSWAAGPLFTFANPAISLTHSPEGLDSGTSVFDFGADFSIGRLWQWVRLEAFATPAWSFGQVASPAVHKTERYSAFTYRFGLALAFLVGS